MTGGAFDTRQRALRRPRSIDEPLLAALVRPLVYVLVAGALAFPLAQPSLALAVAGSAGVGAVVGRLLARSSLRLSAIVLSLGVLFGACVGVRVLLLEGTALAAALGPAQALAWIGIATVGPMAAAAAGLLRALALRARVWHALEVVLVGVAFAGLVVSHRDGAINRPFALADSIIAAGGDPTFALLAVGAVAALLVVLLLLSEPHPLRALLHLGLAIGLLVLLFGSTRMVLPSPQAGSSGLGLRTDEDAEGEGRKAREGEGQGGGQSESSDNEQLDFRDDYDSAGRLVPLAVVLLHDDYSPPTGLYYFRQAAFSQYNGRRLVGATRSEVDGDIAPTFVLEDTRLSPPPYTRGDRVMVETTVALLADHRRPFGLETPLELRPQRNPDPGRFRRIYRVSSAALAADPEALLGRAVGDAGWSEEVRAHYLAHPADERYATLAQQIVAGMPESLREDPVARAYAITLYLSEEGTYSLKSGHSTAEDPTADFLFGDKVGYCVHFSHAAVYLMRALGIPARVGAGYAFDEAARQGGSAILLSGANSHAWPEMWVDGVGWVVADVAPESALDPPVAPPDVDLQQLLGEMARGLDPLPQGEDLPFAPVARVAREAPRIVALAFGVFLVTLVLSGYAVKLWRRAAPVFAGGRARARVVYRAELDRLAEARLRREEGESRERFAARLAAQCPSLAALTLANVARTFGRGAELPRADARALVRELRREVANAVPWYRRFVGKLHPFSWLGAR